MDLSEVRDRNAAAQAMIALSGGGVPANVEAHSTGKTVKTTTWIPPVGGPENFGTEDLDLGSKASASGLPKIPKSLLDGQPGRAREVDRQSSGESGIGGEIDWQDTTVQTSSSDKGKRSRGGGRKRGKGRKSNPASTASKGNPDRDMMDKDPGNRELASEAAGGPSRSNVAQTAPAPWPSTTAGYGGITRSLSDYATHTATESHKELLRSLPVHARIPPQERAMHDNHSRFSKPVRSLLEKQTSQDEPLDLSSEMLHRNLHAGTNGGTPLGTPAPNMQEHFLKSLVMNQQPALHNYPYAGTYNPAMGGYLPPIHPEYAKMFHENPSLMGQYFSMLQQSGAGRASPGSRTVSSEPPVREISPDNSDQGSPSLLPNVPHEARFLPEARKSQAAPGLSAGGSLDNIHSAASDVNRLPPKKRKLNAEDYSKDFPEKIMSLPMIKNGPKSNDTGYGSLPSAVNDISSPLPEEPEPMEHHGAATNALYPMPKGQWIHIDQVRQLLQQQAQQLSTGRAQPASLPSSPGIYHRVKPDMVDIKPRFLPSVSVTPHKVVEPTAVQPPSIHPQKMVKVERESPPAMEPGISALADNVQQDQLPFHEECRQAITPDEEGDLPLHVAVVHEKAEVVDMLMRLMSMAKASIDHPNNLRQTPLHLAVITKNTEIVVRLLESGANPNLAERKGNTALHLAVNYRSKDCLQLILYKSKHKVHMNNKNYEGFTPLHLAVVSSQPEMVQILLDDARQCKSPVNLDLPDGKSGRTALFHASENNQFSIATTLLKKQASVGVFNYAGTTAVQAANGRGHSEMVALLIKYGADINNKDGVEAKAPASLPEPEISSQQAREALKGSLMTRRGQKRRAAETERDSPVSIPPTVSPPKRFLDKNTILQLLREQQMPRNGALRPQSLPTEVTRKQTPEPPEIPAPPPARPAFPEPINSQAAVTAAILKSSPPSAMPKPTLPAGNKPCPPKSLYIPPAQGFGVPQQPAAGSRTPLKVPKSPQQLLLDKGVTSPTFINSRPIVPSAEEQRALLEKISPSISVSSPQQGGRQRFPPPPVRPGTARLPDDQIVPSNGPSRSPVKALDLSTRSATAGSCSQESRARGPVFPPAAGEPVTSSSKEPTPGQDTTPGNPATSDSDEGELMIDEARPSPPTIQLPTRPRPSPGESEASSVELPLPPQVSQDHSSSVELGLSDTEREDSTEPTGKAGENPVGKAASPPPDPAIKSPDSSNSPETAETSGKNSETQPTSPEGKSGNADSSRSRSTSPQEKCQQEK